ncbi:SHOCT domain-containing protein [Anatilimnocola sp. NA78]|uniref:SHOCT domain-containing protein n=1 Tax=Anatilimnocola sp. NA78 TaxID=3415683 RepID=UPI003CE5BCE4
MMQLTSEGQRVVNQLSQSSGFSPDAVTHMLGAVLNGNGSMAQFSHPEFGGGGQWMRGGMLMIGDMFNGYLKGRVDSLCYEISNILSREPGLFQTGSFQSQRQSGSNEQYQAAGGMQGPSSLFVPDPRSNWWPAELGSPNATGSQNNLKYAYFAGSRRLAVDSGGDVWVYDTQDHQIGGFSQQQGSGGSIAFSSQFGTVNLSSLPVVSRNGQSVPHTPSPDRATFSPSTPSPSSTSSSPLEGDVFTAIERLGDLKAKGFISDQEFATKKAELLSRL